MKIKIKKCTVYNDDDVGLNVLSCRADILGTNKQGEDDDESMLNVLRCHLTY